jgi:hypothetical protein
MGRQASGSRHRVDAYPAPASCERSMKMATTWSGLAVSVHACFRISSEPSNETGGTGTGTVPADGASCRRPTFWL